MQAKLMKSGHGSSKPVINIEELAQCELGPTANQSWLQRGIALKSRPPIARRLEALTTVFRDHPRRGEAPYTVNHPKQTRVGRVALHRKVERPQVGTPPALSSDAAIRTQAKLLQEPRTLYFTAKHELFVNWDAMERSVAEVGFDVPCQNMGNWCNERWIHQVHEEHCLPPPWKGGCCILKPLLCMFPWIL